uniref:Predicted protein n=1 Tax=Physcomitrium patens TaxID=3218 RepID=A9TMH4_PHYPA
MARRLKQTKEKDDMSRNVRFRNELPELELRKFEKDFKEADVYGFLRYSRVLPPLDPSIVEEFVRHYDPSDGSSVVHNRIVGLEAPILHKVLYLPIGELAIGSEVTVEFNPELYFRSKADTFVKGQGWKVLDVLKPEVGEWLRFVQKRMALNRHTTYIAKNLLFAAVASMDAQRMHNELSYKRTLGKVTTLLCSNYISEVVKYQLKLPLQEQEKERLKKSGKDQHSSGDKWRSAKEMLLYQVETLLSQFNRLHRMVHELQDSDELSKDLENQKKLVATQQKTIAELEEKLAEKVTKYTELENASSSCRRSFEAERDLARTQLQESLEKCAKLEKDHQQTLLEVATIWDRIRNLEAELDLTRQPVSTSNFEEVAELKTKLDDHQKYIARLEEQVRVLEFANEDLTEQLEKAEEEEEEEKEEEEIEEPNFQAQAPRQYSQLSKVEKLTLEPNKVDLFLQAADRELQEKLELLLEDKEEDEGLTTKWKNIEDAVRLLTKRERRKDRSNIPKTVQAPKAPVHTTPPRMPTVQPSTFLSKKADMEMEEIILRMRDFQIKLARLEENTSINNSKNKDRKIALKDRDDILQTNFGNGRMRALVQDYLKEHETTARESASYGTRVDDEIGRSTETKEFWASAVSTMQEGKLPREALLRTAATIRGKTGWKDPVESLAVHAYIAKSQHEALMEEKRRGNFDDTREGNSSKRQTQGDKAREAASQELPVKDTSVELEEKTKETKDKGKSIAYKLLFDIEATTNLKGVLEERILNAKVEFTLKEVLGIVKKEFYDVIIDSIKRKRQLMGKTGMSHAIDARIYKDEEEVDIGYKQPTNEKNGYNQRVGFKDYSDKEMVSRP